MIRRALFALALSACSRDEPPRSTPPPAEPSPSALVAPPDASVPPADAGTPPDPKADPRTFVIAPDAVKCPAVPRPAHAEAPLRATGAEAGLLVSTAGFLRDDIGVPEAVALLGDPVLCDQSASSHRATWYLWPHAASAHPVDLELRDDELVGIAITLDPPVLVDTTALAAKLGAPSPLRAPPYAMQPDGAVFEVTTPVFTAQLMYSHRDEADPPTAWHVHQIVYRRTRITDSLPQGFHTEADVTRLIGLALRKTAPAPVEFYGTVGVLDKVAGTHITFRPAPPIRNVASATIERRTVGARDYLHAIHIEFATPIAVSSLAAPAGVVPTIVDGKLTAIAITRPD